MIYRVFTLWALVFVFKLYQVQCNEQCGVIRQNSDNRIVNGRDVGYKRYPWFAALFQAKNKNQLACGGTLISPGFVVSAAHCFKPFFKEVKEGNITLKEIYMVKVDLNNVCITDPGAQVMTVNKVFIPKEYYIDLLYYDIALLALDHVVDLIPICLPKARYESNNRTNFEGQIIGLGKEASSAWKLPCSVKEANVPIQPDSVCKKMLKDHGEEPDKFQGAFCAGYAEGGTDTCQGDSGGPLQIYQEDTDTYTLLGITSYGFGCANKDAYGVYTDVSHYTDWIHKNVKEYNQANHIRNNTTASKPTTAEATTTTEATTTIEGTTTTRAPNAASIHHRKKSNGYNWLKELIFD